MLHVIYTISFILWCGLFIVFPLYCATDYLSAKLSKAKHYTHGVPKSRVTMHMPEPLHTAEELTRLEFAMADSPKPLHNGALVKYADEVYYVTINTEMVKDFNDVIKEVRRQRRNYMTININDLVKIRLTPLGIETLRKQHDDLNERCKGRLGKFKLIIDADGYCELQLWEIMQSFGKYCGNGMPLMFNTEIKLFNTIK